MHVFQEYPQGSPQWWNFPSTRQFWESGKIGDDPTYDRVASVLLQQIGFLLAELIDLFIKTFTRAEQWLFV